mgnify:FL=1
MPKSAITLGIETSCDETSAAVVRAGEQVLSNVISTQIPLHRRYGGVVPEIASRQHVEAIVPVVEEALQQAQIGWSDLSHIAVTAGPGLVGALLVGLSYAKALAYSLKVPLVGVNHLEGHIYANFLAHKVQLPILCLVVSGGHTDLVYMAEHGCYQSLGRTRDDAAGEAFDKIARALGLPYPGGPEIDRVARMGHETAFDFPRAWLEPDSFDFSFSGLKSAVLNELNRLTQKGDPVPLADVAASFQAAVVEVLVTKAIAAALAKQVPVLYVAGGVAANSYLRQKLTEAALANGLEVRFPPIKLCTDNAAMIAAAGFHYWQAGRFANLHLNATPNLPLVSK